MYGNISTFFPPSLHLFFTFFPPSFHLLFTFFPPSFHRYEPELIRSAIPNYFLAELASKHVKMCLTGEGADELFAGYVYFRDAPDKEALQRELRRIFNHLGIVNLKRTDRMKMAHGLEARVPFLDVDFVQVRAGPGGATTIVWSYSVLKIHTENTPWKNMRGKMTMIKSRDSNAWKE